MTETTLTTKAELQDALFAHCDAADTRLKLEQVDVSPHVLEAAVAAEREVRVATCAGRLRSIVSAKRDQLVFRKAQVEAELTDFDIAFGLAEATDVTTISESPIEVPERILEKLASGKLDYEDFISLAKLLGHKRLVATRAFNVLDNKKGESLIRLEPYRPEESSYVIYLDQLTDFVTQPDVPDHFGNDPKPPLTRLSMFGPKMFDLVTDVCNAYLQAREQAQAETARAINT